MIYLGFLGFKIHVRVRWQERITNKQVRRRCGMENLEHRLRKTRLRWFGHVKCRNENSVLRRPVGRPKKT